MDGKSCLFCDIWDKKSGVVSHNDVFYMQFDKFPVSPGHAEVIPVRHVASSEEMNTREQIEFWQFFNKALRVVRETDLAALYRRFLDNPVNEESRKLCLSVLESPYINTPMVDFNGGWNNGTAAGRTIGHLHFHIIPRYEGDVEDPVGGVRHIIPGKGNYKKLKI